MKSILSLFWQICRLRQSPEHVPTYTWFVALVVVANFVGNIAVSVLAGLSTASDNPTAERLTLLQISTGALVSIASTAALVWFALQIRELSQRFFATITALFGCDLLITASFGALLPLLGLAEPLLAAIPLAFLLYLVWFISVMGFILHRALDVQLAAGVCFAVAFSLIGLAVSEVALGR